MALTLTYQNKAYFGAASVLVSYSFTATGSGDTVTLTVSGPQPSKVEFMDANSNQITSSPPTCGAWTTTGGSSACTLTANSGGVVTNGKILIVCAGA